jgi:hypothetical protein
VIVLLDSCSSATCRDESACDVVPAHARQRARLVLVAEEDGAVLGGSVSINLAIRAR